MDNTEVIKLIAQYRVKNCQKSFNKIYMNFHNAVYFVIKKYSYMSLFEEIKSLSFMTLFEAIYSKYDLKSNMKFLTYLVRTINFRVIDFLRVELRNENFTDDLLNIESENCLLDEFDIKEKILEMNRVSKFLNDRHREVYQMLKKGYKQKEIAKELNLTSARVNQIKTNIVEFIKENMWEKVIEKQTDKNLTNGIEPFSRKINYYQYANAFLY